MSKEQTRSNTPITADYIKKEILKGLSEVFRGKTIYMKDIEVSIEQYAELRIQQEREKWKEEVIKAYQCGQDYEAYKGMKLEPYPNGLEYYESVVKPKYE